MELLLLALLEQSVDYPYPVDIYLVIVGAKSLLLHHPVSARLGGLVIAGPVEATTIGNVQIQAHTVCCTGWLDELRAPMVTVIPRRGPNPHTIPARRA